MPSIFISRYEDISQLILKSLTSGEEESYQESSYNHHHHHEHGSKKHKNYDITLSEFHDMFSKVPSMEQTLQHQQRATNTENKVVPFNNHIEKKDDTTFWVYDPTDFDPWFVAKFNPPNSETFVASNVEFIVSTTAPRYIRNIMNAIQVAFKMATAINANCYLKDSTKSYTITNDSIRKWLFDPQMVFVKDKQKEWIDKMELMVQKKMAPLEFPIGNMDMIRDFFFFEITRISDVVATFKSLHKIIPPSLSVAALDANLMDIPEFRQATPEERPISRFNEHENHSCLIIDRKSKICKTKVEWDSAEKVLRVSSNYFARPPVGGMYRTLPFHSLASCTLLICKSIMIHLGKSWSDDCFLNTRSLNEEFVKNLQEKLKHDPISTEFYYWLEQAQREDDQLLLSDK
ncbi:hypothetical protein C9374_005210 [Naegleria lovaniensis]|uniref:Uncharacterized protein n=1 Tax=Naegleria lovaniensis TaxID=51637 RepID=A0AA88GLW2_NAELO|nr:uncharacterized protein C9374_005210 [Naegleria lovaniensis]KAG2382630.1 hypothetical protein C9374_005210 [Naegleria lovaniensis]